MIGQEISISSNREAIVAFFFFWRVDGGEREYNPNLYKPVENEKNLTYTFFYKSVSICKSLRIHTLMA